MNEKQSNEEAGHDEITRNDNSTNSETLSSKKSPKLVESRVQSHNEVQADSFTLEDESKARSLSRSPRSLTSRKEEVETKQRQNGGVRRTRRSHSSHRSSCSCSCSSRSSRRSDGSRSRSRSKSARRSKSRTYSSQSASSCSSSRSRSCSSRSSSSRSSQSRDKRRVRRRSSKKANNGDRRRADTGRRRRRRATPSSHSSSRSRSRRLSSSRSRSSRRRSSSASSSRSYSSRSSSSSRASSHRSRSKREKRTKGKTNNGRSQRNRQRHSSSRSRSSRSSVSNSSSRSRSSTNSRRKTTHESVKRFKNSASTRSKLNPTSALPFPSHAPQQPATSTAYSKQRFSLNNYRQTNTNQMYLNRNRNPAFIGALNTSNGNVLGSNKKQTLNAPSNNQNTIPNLFANTTSTTNAAESMNPFYSSNDNGELSKPKPLVSYSHLNVKAREELEKRKQKQREEREKALASGDSTQFNLAKRNDDAKNEEAEEEAPAIPITSYQSNLNSDDDEDDEDNESENVDDKREEENEQELIEKQKRIEELKQKLHLTTPSSSNAETANAKRFKAIKQENKSELNETAKKSKIVKPIIKTTTTQQVVKKQPIIKAGQLKREVADTKTLDRSLLIGPRPAPSLPTANKQQSNHSLQSETMSHLSQEPVNSTQLAEEDQTNAESSNKQPINYSKDELAKYDELFKASQMYAKYNQVVSGTEPEPQSLPSDLTTGNGTLNGLNEINVVQMDVQSASNSQMALVDLQTIQPFASSNEHQLKDIEAAIPLQMEELEGLNVPSSITLIANKHQGINTNPQTSSTSPTSTQQTASNEEMLVAQQSLNTLNGQLPLGLSLNSHLQAPHLIYAPQAPVQLVTLPNGVSASQLIQLPQSHHISLAAVLQQQQQQQQLLNMQLNPFLHQTAGLNFLKPVAQPQLAFANHLPVQYLPAQAAIHPQYVQLRPLTQLTAVQSTAAVQPQILFNLPTGFYENTFN